MEYPFTSVSYRSDLAAKDNDYSQGFAPTIGNEISEITFYKDNNGDIKPNPIYELGDPKELLLSIVLDNIQGGKRIQRRISESATISRTPIGSSLDRKPSLMIIGNQDIK